MSRSPTGARRFCRPAPPERDLARSIGPGLAKAAIAVRVNGEVRDLARPLPDGATVAILTERDPQALDVLRHSSAHVLATAVRELFPHARIGFGPPIEDGFYYDFEVPTPFTPEDLEKIEARDAGGHRGRPPVRARGGEPRRGASGASPTIR